MTGSIRYQEAGGGEATEAAVSGTATALLLIAVAAVVAVSRVLVATAPDVSWALQAATVIAEGGRLGVDVVELNPPGAIFIYLPAVWMARLVAIPAEYVLNGLVLALASSVVVWFARSLSRASVVPPDRAMSFALLALLLLAVVPSRTFAQREHIGLLLLLPWIGLVVARMSGDHPDITGRIAAGTLAGLAMVAKPHFAVTIAVVSILALWRLRSLIGLLPEVVPAGVVVLLYVIAVLAAVPDFVTTTIPLAALVYVPLKRDLLVLLATGGPLVVALVFYAHCRLHLGGIDRPATLVFFSASAAGVVTWLLQSKGWAYHTLPMVLFSLLALLAGAFETRLGYARLRANLPAAAAAIASLVVAWQWFATQTDSADDRVAAHLRALGPAPRVALIGGDFSLAFPAVRKAAATWGMRPQSQWAAAGALARLADPRTPAPLRDRLAAIDLRARQDLATDLARFSPDAILVDVTQSDGIDWLGWSRRDRDVAAAIAGYPHSVRVGPVLILSRTLPRPPG